MLNTRILQLPQYDIELLQTLANQASLALGWARLLLEPLREIEQATSELFRLEDVLASVCKEIQSSQGFEFAAIQLIHPKERIIETMHGTGIAAAWSYRVRHYLTEDPNLQNIQASVAQSGHTEIIVGWDPRFDEWLYDTFDHKWLVRVFTPIVLVRDENGKVVNDWWDRRQWHVVHDEEIADEEKQRKGHRTVLQMDKGQPGETDEIIGTVEVGYQNAERCIGPEQAEALVRLIAKQALDIHKALLPYVLEVIAEQARQIFRADAVMLYYGQESHQRHFIYEACAGQLSRRSQQAHPPREHGLGWQAIQARAPMIIPDPSKGHYELELESFNPAAFEQGIRAMVAFPLLIDEQNGVLYVLFRHQHRFTEDEIGWIQLFANRAVSAIRHVTTYTQTRDRTRQLAALQSIDRSLVSMAEGSDLLRHVAWNTLNMLAADVVTIYEYVEVEKRFLTPPDIAGRLVAREAMAVEVNYNTAPVLLVKHGYDIYADKSTENPVLNNPVYKDTLDHSPFITRERIESSCGILLKVDKKTVGVMFINYRRPHSFSDEEKGKRSQGKLVENQ